VMMAVDSAWTTSSMDAAAACRCCCWATTLRDLPQGARGDDLRLSSSSSSSLSSRVLDADRPRPRSPRRVCSSSPSSTPPLFRVFLERRLRWSSGRSRGSASSPPGGHGQTPMYESSLCGDRKTADWYRRGFKNEQTLANARDGSELRRQRNKIGGQKNRACNSQTTR
jgi:hypothetical protein